MSEQVAPVSDHDGTPEGLIASLKERPGEAAVTYFENITVHSHILYNPESGDFDFEVHQTVTLPWEEEGVLSEELGLSAEEVAIRLQILAARDHFEGLGETVPEEVEEELSQRFQLVALASMLGITYAELIGE
jgi:hypothetical protein